VDPGFATGGRRTTASTDQPLLLVNGGAWGPPMPGSALLIIRLNGCYLEVVGEPITIWIGVFNSKENVSCWNESPFRHGFDTYWQVTSVFLSHRYKALINTLVVSGYHS